MLNEIYDHYFGKDYYPQVNYDVIQTLDYEHVVTHSTNLNDQREDRLYLDVADRSELIH